MRDINRQTQRAQQLALFGIVLLGLLLRLHAAGNWNATHPDSRDRLWGDELGYDGLALGLLHGSVFEWPGRVPLYPLWLMAIHWISGQSYDAIPYVQSMLGTTAVPLTFRLGGILFGPKVGLVAATLTATSYPLIQQPLRLLSEILFTPFVLLACIALLNAMSARAKFSRYFSTGIWIGLSDLIRPTFLFLPFFLLLVPFICRKRYPVRCILACLFAALLVITPWMVRNYTRYGEVFPLATSNAFFWLGSPEYYRLVREQGWSTEQVWEFLWSPDRPDDPQTIQGDRHWTVRALDSIRQEPLRYLGLMPEKVAYYWLGHPNQDWGDTHILNYGWLRQVGVSRGEAVMLILARLMPIVALLGAIVLHAHWRRLMPIYTMLGYCTVLHAATHAEARLSDPLQPLLFVVIAGGTAELWRHNAKRRSLPARAEVPR
jgi:4-amino-4-deoxy-L-arabinose transferase-like glycosyltransferase